MTRLPHLRPATRCRLEHAGRSGCRQLSTGPIIDFDNFLTIGCDPPSAITSVGQDSDAAGASFLDRQAQFPSHGAAGIENN